MLQVAELMCQDPAGQRRSYNSIVTFAIVCHSGELQVAFKGIRAPILVHIVHMNAYIYIYMCVCVCVCVCVCHVRSESGCLFPCALAIRIRVR